MRAGPYWYRPNVTDPSLFMAGNWIQIEIFQGKVFVMGHADVFQIPQLKGEFKAIPGPNEYEEVTPWSRKPGQVQPVRVPYTGPRRLNIEE